MRTFNINIPDDRGKFYEVVKYPAGEIQVRLTVEGIFAATGKDYYIITANPIPDLIELAQLKSALDGLPIKWYFSTLDLPYLPYARADRRFVPGDSFGLEVFANLINSMGFDLVYTFDVHSRVSITKIPRLVNLRPDFISVDQIEPCIGQLGRKGLCLIVPDKGALTRYELDRYKLKVFSGEKVRDAKSGKLSGFAISSDIQNFKKGLIIDDICDGGGTFIGLAEEIHRLNPRMKLSLYVSHGIFSKRLAPLLQQFQNVYTSDFSFKNPNINRDKI